MSDDKGLYYIYNSKINDESKLLMFETYEIFKLAIKNPYSLISWDPYNKKKLE